MSTGTIVQCIGAVVDIEFPRDQMPQVYNAQRYSVDMAAFPTIRRVNEHCLTLRAFDAARPEKQPDAPAAN